ncbi:bifunctional N-acetylglucosamine-1-phosphate uridyltransferase/glucosamine-1-phosphate acetyltransferase [Candidatus Omnitrophota bacterium]
MNNKDIAVIILAAGKGVRMRSSLPKALCELSGKPMVEFLLDSVSSSRIKNVIVVGGYKIQLLRKRLASRDLKIVEQKSLLGSADAVKQAKTLLKNFGGSVLVLYADTPLIKESTLKQLIRSHQKSKATATILTVKTGDPKEYGRIARDEKGNICNIIEHTDIGGQGTGFRVQGRYEINVGAYCFDSKKLFDGLARIKKNKIKGEYYLTDIIPYLYNKGYKVNSYAITDIEEAMGLNRREDMVHAEDVLNRRTVNKLLDSGVMIKDPKNTYIQADAKIGKDTTIYPFVVIGRNVKIGRGCKIGPFVHLRPGAILKDGAEVGNFVEIVRSSLGPDSKAKHLTYLGDAHIGRNVNIGAGTITANYDGKSKNITIIDDNSFIGSGTTIVAPVKIGKRASTGAGCVVVKGRNVLPGTTVVGVPAKPINHKVKKKR